MIPGRFIGLISGTSVDGLDIALVYIDADGLPESIVSQMTSMPVQLQGTLRELAQARFIEPETLGRADAWLGRWMGQEVLAFLHGHRIDAETITAIGSHGQTVRHGPRAEPPFTLQIGDPNALAEATGIPVVADFRRRDVAAGGEGAPLVPAFHRAAFMPRTHVRCIVNIGGIANITILDPHRPSFASGFDTGPGNCLLDGWFRRHCGGQFDRDGAMAATGIVNTALLERLIGDPYFDRPTPKSTGPEHFNLAWLESHLDGIAPIDVADVLATLVELTAISITSAIRKHAPNCSEIVLCGGGRHNMELRRRIDATSGGAPAIATDDLGIDGDYVEASAFAWLAWRTVNHLPGNAFEATGAAGPRVLGGIWPGRRGLGAALGVRDNQPSGT